MSIVLKDRATLEGFAGVTEGGSNALKIASTARLVGFAHSAGTMTLDGTVLGCVMTRDFSFYEAPTMYRGWLRAGTIDRTALPAGVWLPTVLDESTSMAVVQWW